MILPVNVAPDNNAYEDSDDVNAYEDSDDVNAYADNEALVK